MSYNDGWRKYEDIPEKKIKVQILLTSKFNIEKQLEKQIKKIEKISDKNKLLTLNNSTHKRRSSARLRLQTECEVRDNLQRKICIIEKWIEELKEEVLYVKAD